MIRVKDYESPLGKMLLACDDDGLRGIWFYGGRDFAHGLNDYVYGEHSILHEAERWLNIYFSGEVPDFTPRLNVKGSEFQLKVWDILRTIPYGHTMTYGEIARMISPSMSAQAIGGAVGRNDVSIIIPCHRVIGADGSLTGYGGGIERKEKLLRLEGVNLSM